MANATKYVDNVNGDNGNTGDSEAQAYADIATALAAISGGGNTIYVQAGSPYTITSTISVTVVGDTTDGPNILEGYTTTPGARDGRPTITSATNSVVLFTLNGATGFQLRHLELTHTAGTRGKALATVTASMMSVVVFDCVIDGVSEVLNDGFTFTTMNISVYDTEIKNTTTGGIGTAAGIVANNVSFVDCAGLNFHDCGVSGSSADIRNCRSNGGSSFISLTGTTSGGLIKATNNLAVGVFSGSGIICNQNGANSVIVDNVIYGVGGYGISSSQGTNLTDINWFVRRNAIGSTTSGHYNNVTTPSDDAALTLSTNPCIDSANGDFNINDTAGGGAILRAHNITLDDTNFYSFRQLLDELPTTTVVKFAGARR